jgi:porphobilinogen deaminase
MNNLSKREKQLDIFLNSIKTQEDWIKDKEKYIIKITNLYSKYLEDYTIVKNISEYEMILVGGYVRYVDSMDELKWGGILIKKIKKNNIDYMILANTNMKRLTVSFYRNTIFYKNHTTASDKTKKFFISYLDKINE